MPSQDLLKESFPRRKPLPYMSETRRRLPHIYPEGKWLFVTWHLQGSLPHDRYPPPGLRAGEAFVWMDRYLDTTRLGPMYLSRQDIARIVVNSLQRGVELGHYDLRAWAIMANHVHVLLRPKVSAQRVCLARLKGCTAREANLVLGSTGQPFWQAESYDHWVRDAREFERIVTYIENNPVKAGFVTRPEDYPWSSAAKPGRARRQESRRGRHECLRHAYLWRASSYTSWVSCAVRRHENSAARRNPRSRHGSARSGCAAISNMARTSSACEPACKAAPAGDFRNRRVPRGDHASPALHGFQHRQSEPFIERRIDERQRSRQQLRQPLVGHFTNNLQPRLGRKLREIGSAPPGQYQIHRMHAPHLAPGRHQAWNVLARLQGSGIQKIWRPGSRRRCAARPETGGSGMRDGADAVRMNPEPLDGLLPHRLAGGHDHGGQTQSDQQRRALAHPARVGMPCRVHPRGKVVQRQNAGTARQIGHREIRAVEQSGVQALQFAVQAPEPPAALGRDCAARRRAAD